VLGTGASTLVIGVLALFMSRLPGGIVGTIIALRGGAQLPRGLVRAYAEAAPSATTDPDEAEIPLQPTAFAQTLLAERALERAGR
jgi:hypothetical protein